MSLNFLFTSGFVQYPNTTVPVPEIVFPCCVLPLRIVFRKIWKILLSVLCAFKCVFCILSLFPYLYEICYRLHCNHSTSLSKSINTCINYYNIATCIIHTYANGFYLPWFYIYKYYVIVMMMESGQINFIGLVVVLWYLDSVHKIAYLRIVNVFCKVSSQLMSFWAQPHVPSFFPLSIAHSLHFMNKHDIL